MDKKGDQTTVKEGEEPLRSNLISKLEKDYCPFYVTFFKKFHILYSQIPILRVIPRWLSPVLIGLLLYIVGILIALSTGDISEALQAWILAAGAVVFSLGQILLLHAHERTEQALKGTVYMLKKPDQFEDLEDHLYRMFRSKGQLLICGLGAVGFVVFIFFAGVLEFDFHSVYLAFILISAVFVAFLLAPGFWLALTSAFFIHQVGNFGELKLNPLAPERTLGLKKLAGLLATFSVSFTFESIIAMIAITLYSWPTESLYYEQFVRGWLFFLIPFVIFYFFYPQLALWRLIRKKKEEILKFYERQTLELAEEGLSIAEMEHLVYLQNLYTKIDSSSNFVFIYNPAAISKVLGSLSGTAVLLWVRYPDLILHYLKALMP